MHWRAEQEGAAHTQLSPRWARVAKPTVIEGRLFRAHSLKKHYIVKTYYFRLTVRKLQVLMLTKEEYSINNRRSTCIYFSIFSPFLYECWNKELSKLWKNHKIFQKINFYLKSCHPPSLPVPDRASNLDQARHTSYPLQKSGTAHGIYTIWTSPWILLFRYFLSFSR